MTTEHRHPESEMTSAPGPSVHVRRARRLLLGGLAGGVAAALVCAVVFTVGYGTAGLASVALAAGMVLFFYAVGQLVMVRFADAGARTLLAVSMASYTSRVFLLGLLLLVYQNNRDSWTTLLPMAVFITTVAVVAGWLLVELLVFSRLRIGHFDTEYTGASTGGYDQ